MWVGLIVCRFWCTLKVMAPFRWNDWNLGHIGEHGVSAEEAEEVIRGARQPYPEKMGRGKFRVRGSASGGR